MVEVNVKLAGFTDIQTCPATFFNEFSNKKEETLCVTFTRHKKAIF